MNEYTELNNCLVCDNGDLIKSLDLGSQPLINNLKTTAEEKEESYPLVLNNCQYCSHQQLSIAVNPELLFKNYLYQTGVSESHQEFFKQFVALTRGKTVLDIGCNDGSLLKEFKKNKWEVLGIDPAENLNVEGIEVIKDFFPSDKLIGKRFDCITAFNVFAHNSDPKKFLKSMKEILSPSGRIFILTTPSKVGNIYHEHVSYFNFLSMSVLCSYVGLDILRFNPVPMHGGSNLFELININKLILPSRDVKTNFNKPVVGYGAAANGMALLNYYNIKPEYVVDDNPLKQGKFVPGVNVPIYDSTKIGTDKRDLIIMILAYNLSHELIKKIKLLRPNNKDVFISPLTGDKYE